MTAIPPGARRFQQQGTTFYVVGEQRAFFRDLYHLFLRLPWLGTFGVIGLMFLASNLMFAIPYWLGGGVTNASGSYFDAFSFSVQTMATIGYGQMYPSSPGATTVMIVESVYGLMLTALATGIIFAKFSRPTTRVAFSKNVVITQHEGKRTLIFRVGNRRNNVIIEATLHVIAVVTTTTQEGKTFYKAHDLKLVRDRQVGMTRGWTVLHVIDETSPFFALRDRAAVEKAEVEIHISLTGVDDVTMQQVNTVQSYTRASDFAFDHHFADVIVPLDNGEFMTDVGKFDTIIPDDDRVRA